MSEKYLDSFILPFDIDFYKNLLLNPLVGITITDANMKVIFVNEAQSRITGQAKELYIGKSMKKLVEDGIVTSSATIEVFKTKTEAFINQSSHAGKAFQVKGVPIFDKVGNISYVLNYLIDVSELVEMKNAFCKMQEDKQLIEENLQILRDSINKDDTIIYHSKIMKDIVYLAEKIAPSDVTVMITGPSGSGKEVIANHIHKSSKRCNNNFVKINCAAIPENLLESELFGYESGAFTGGNPKGKAGLFEYANNGTVLLDEIGEMPLPLQSKMLRVLQDQKIRRIGGNKTMEVNFRLIVSTNADLKSLIAEKKFREDLYYRLNVVEINMPSLEKRKEDIPFMIEYFIRIFNIKYDCNKRIDFDTKKYLISKKYQGNVRELRNIIERLVVQSNSDEITLKDAYEGFGIDSFIELEEINIGVEAMMGLSLKEMVNKFEKKILTEYIKIYGSRNIVAEKLKTDQSTISRKLKSD